MPAYLAAVSFFPTPETAEHAADQLRLQGFALQSVPAANAAARRQHTVSWCASPPGTQSALAAEVLEQICLRILVGSVGTELRAAMLPQQALHQSPTAFTTTEHMVIAYGTPDQVNQAVEALLAAGALDVDLF